MWVKDLQPDEGVLKVSGLAKSLNKLRMTAALPAVGVGLAFSPNAALQIISPAATLNHPQFAQREHHHEF